MKAIWIAILAAIFMATGCGTTSDDFQSTHPNLEPIGPVQFAAGTPTQSIRDMPPSWNRSTPELTSMHVRVLHGGIEYRTIAPIDLTAPGHDTDSMLPPEEASQLGVQQSALEGGTDDRYHIGNHVTAFPFKSSAMILYEDDLTDAFYYCTASLIGPHTFVTAAHCLYKINVGWYDLKFIALGLDDGNTGPYCNFATQQFVNCPLDLQDPATATLTVPDQWTSSFDPQYDMGIITIGGAYSTWFGTKMNEQAALCTPQGIVWAGSSLSTRSGPKISRSGYDTDKQQCGPACGQQNVDYQQWSANGTIYPMQSFMPGQQSYCDPASPFLLTDAFMAPPAWNGVSFGTDGAGVYYPTSNYKVLGIELTPGEGLPNLPGQISLVNGWRQWSYDFVHGTDPTWP